MIGVYNRTILVECESEHPPRSNMGRNLSSLLVGMPAAYMDCRHLYRMVWASFDTPAPISSSFRVKCSVMRS